MSSYPLIGMLVGFGLTVGLIRFLAPLAERLGLIDHPGGRKRHVARTPTVGGVAIAAGLLLTALLTGLALLPVAIQSRQPGHEIEGPMAVVILGGLVSSTIVSLILVPPLAARWLRYR